LVASERRRSRAARLERCRAGGDRVDEQPPLAELEQRLADAVSREDWDVAVTLRDELRCSRPPVWI